MARHDERARTLVRRTTTAHEHLSLGILAGTHGLDLVFGKRRVPAEDRLERLVDRPEESVDRAVPGRLGATLVATDADRDGTGRVPSVRRAHAPADEGDRRRHLGRAL